MNSGDHVVRSTGLTLLFTSFSLGRISSPKPSAWPLTLLPPFMWFPRANTSPTTLLTPSLSSRASKQKTHPRSTTSHGFIPQESPCYQRLDWEFLKSDTVFLPHRLWRLCWACVGWSTSHRWRPTGRWCSELCLQSPGSERARTGTWNGFTEGKMRLMLSICLRPA